MRYAVFRKIHNLFLLLVGCVVVVLIAGCKDTPAVHQAGLLETCKELIDERNWDDAISDCPDVDNDEGWHLTAQAYMGRAGLSLFDVVNTLLSSSGDGGASSIIFGYIPETAADTNDYKDALNALLGTDSSGSPHISDKTQSVYLEALLVSSMLIFKELKTLLGLSVVDGVFTTCSLDSTADNTCTFIPTVGTQLVEGLEVPERLIFGGLGSSFYTGVCGQASDPTHDGTKQTDISSDVTSPANDPDKIGVTVTNDVTVDSCTIQVGSPLYYNKIASQGFTGASEITGLEVLDFYSQMDQGKNFSFEVVPAYDAVAAVELAFCNSGYIEPSGASDDKVNDCEILAMFADESSDLF